MAACTSASGASGPPHVRRARSGDRRRHHRTIRRVQRDALPSAGTGRPCVLAGAPGRQVHRVDPRGVEPGELARYDRARLAPLFNRTGHEPPKGGTPPHRIDPAQLAATIAEFYRVLGLSVVGLGRAEYIVCLSGQELLRRMILDLMLDENGVRPNDRGGALRRNPLLTEAQRAELAALPAVKADHEGILAGNLALAAIFLPRARRLAAHIGAPWPSALETATRDHLRRHLGVDLPI